MTEVVDIQYNHEGAYERKIEVISSKYEEIEDVDDWDVWLNSKVLCRMSIWVLKEMCIWAVCFVASAVICCLEVV
ncbi:hypothetical protein O3M35_007756 [Rhynocoris fuscipes]|uniref:Uncharacterized protein n=1 Tax=Rhynocoris fuscipes TaxID=488301 RepID=A0AAW1DD50_9HEMI